MTQFHPIGAASDRVMQALIVGLSLEFGPAAGEALAERFLAAEDADFHWDARQDERWIGRYEAAEDDECELDCVAVIGRLDGRWYVAIVIVDGDGLAHGMSGKRSFSRRVAALNAFAQVH